MELRAGASGDQDAVFVFVLFGPVQLVGELTAQVGVSNCKTWYENEFQVSYETNLATNSLVFVHQVLQSSFLEINSEIPT